jgi:hypothetical protein
MAKGRTESPPTGGANKFVRGRKAGVEGTYGSKSGMGPDALRHMKGVAEATAIQRDEKSEGGGDAELASTAKSLYRDAVENKGDKYGDKALTER